MHSAPYLAAFGLLTIVHALRVIRLRWKHKVAIGDGDIQELKRMIRVFGNHAEYVPIGMVLLVALELVQSPLLYLHVTGAMLLMGRTLHGIGLSRTHLPNAGRFMGMFLTLSSLLLASIGVVLFSILPRGV